MEWKDIHDLEVGLPLGLASSNLCSSGFSSSHTRQFACSMIMLRMMMKMVFPLGAVVIQVYHPVLCPKTVGLFHDDVDNGAGAREIIPVHHLPSRFIPPNSWFVPHACPPHDQLPQVAILGNPEFWQKKESQSRRKQPHMQLSQSIWSSILKQFSRHNWSSEPYWSLWPQRPTLQLLEIQTFERLSHSSGFAQLKSITGAI